MTDDSAYKRSQLRLPHELHAAIVAAAEGNGRSMNNEIVTRLEASFDGGSGVSPDVLERTQVLLKSTSGLLSFAAYYLKECAARVPRDSETTSVLMDNIERFADSLSQGNIAGSIGPIKEIIELGKKIGVIDPVSGKAKPEYLQDHPMYPPAMPKKGR